MPERETEEKKEVTGCMKHPPRPRKHPTPSAAPAERSSSGHSWRAGLLHQPEFPQGVQKVPDISCHLFHTGKDIQEEERVFQPIACPRCFKELDNLAQSSAHKAKRTNGARTLRLWT